MLMNIKIASGRYVGRWRFLLRHLHCHFIGWQNILRRRHFEVINARNFKWEKKRKKENKTIHGSSAT